jgi:uncharacterized protein
MERKVIYFETPGRENTSACLEVVEQSLDVNGYKHIVIATTTGETGMLFSEALNGKGVNLKVLEILAKPRA